MYYHFTYTLLIYYWLLWCKSDQLTISMVCWLVDEPVTASDIDNSSSSVSVTVLSSNFVKEVEAERNLCKAFDCFSSSFEYCNFLLRLNDPDGFLLLDIILSGGTSVWETHTLYTFVGRTRGARIGCAVRVLNPGYCARRHRRSKISRIISCEVNQCSSMRYEKNLRKKKT